MKKKMFCFVFLLLFFLGVCGVGTGVGVWEFFDKESKYEFFFERGGGGKERQFL